MPIGRTPGCLSSAMRRQARSGAIDDGCTYEVQTLIATEAREAQRSLDAPLWLVQRRLHSWESRPEGSAAPFTLNAAEWMALTSRDSNITGWRSCGSSVIIQEVYAGRPTGCLLISDSLTVGEFRLSGLARSSRWRMPPFPSLDKRSRAAFHFPSNIRLEKERDRLELTLVDPFLCSLCCMALPSLTSSSKSPLDHHPNLLSRCVMQSCQVSRICGRSPGFCLFRRLSPELPLRHFDLPHLHGISTTL